jgi:hypothetical protein
VEYEGRWNVKTATKVFEKIAKHFGGKKKTFLLDNCPVFSSKGLKRWAAKEKFSIKHLPPRSPDLSVWDSAAIAPIRKELAREIEKIAGAHEKWSKRKWENAFQRSFKAVMQSSAPGAFIRGMRRRVEQILTTPRIGGGLPRIA